MSLITRKPVGGPRNAADTLSTPLVPSYEGHVYDDGVSAMSRRSSHYSLSEAAATQAGDFASTFSPDTGYHGYDIGEQGMPLMEMSSEEAAPRNNSSQSLTKGIPDVVEEHEIIHLDLEDQSKWLPKALRWPFMTVLFLVALGLGILVLGLTIHSQEHQGLGSVQETSIFLFGWRFTPTLFAVIYTLLLMSTFNDIRLTEVYARLSRPEGSSAESSLFYKPRLFWYDPFDALSRRKNDGSRNPALFWASTVYIMALLIVSPFSAAFLAPAEVLVARKASFSRLATSVASPMPLRTDDSVFFRTISSVILNTSTSAWLGSNYTILLFGRSV